MPGSGQGQLITVKTDVLSLTINTRGGDIEQANLLAYPDALGSKGGILIRVSVLTNCLLSYQTGSMPQFRNENMSDGNDNAAPTAD